MAAEEEEEEDTGSGTTATFSPSGARHQAPLALPLARPHRPTTATGTAARDTGAGTACLGSLLHAVPHSASVAQCRRSY